MKYIINTKADLDYVIDKDPEFAEEFIRKLQASRIVTIDTQVYPEEQAGGKESSKLKPIFNTREDLKTLERFAITEKELTARENQLNRKKQP